MRELGSTKLLFCFIQLVCTQSPHQYLHTQSFLGLFIFHGPFCTVTKFCSLEVDRICHWYQSLLSLLLRAQEMVALEQGIGWEPEECWVTRKAVFLIFLKLLLLLNLPMYIFLCYFFFSFCGTGIWTQGLMFARQALYQLSHSSSPSLMLFIFYTTKT
jgi:hypothetical protein